MRPKVLSDSALLDVARRMFLEQGPGISTSSIASELGVSQGTIFKRFSTKEELMIRALMPAAPPSWVDALAAGPDERPVPEQLLAILQNVEEFFIRSMPAFSVLKAANIDPTALFKKFPGEPPPVRAHNALVAFLEQLHAQGRIRAPHPRATASAFLGAVHGPYQMRYCLGNLAPDCGENYAEHMVQAFWAGIRPE